MIGIDCIGPLPKTSSGMKYIVVATDYVSKWVEAKAIKHKSAHEIAKFLVEEVFTHHGPAKIIRSDQVLEFNNKLVRLTAKLSDSKFKYSSPYHPETDGLAERTNQTLVLKLGKMVAEYRAHWDKVLPFVLLRHRLSPIGKFRMSPYEMLYGRKAVLPRFLDELPSDFEFYFIDPVEYLNERLSKLENDVEIVKHHNKKVITRAV